MKKETRKEIEAHLDLLREESRKLASKKLTGNSAVELAFMDNAIVAVETLLSLSPQEIEDMDFPFPLQ